ncbi:MAG: hypothetical protein QG585_335 [Patescibacteria group bacterium]|jgi:uncharacterized membrane protein YidH (DUF202 family)|nr:hypothetical protein [Patescibacteria group bacterium]
MKKRVFLICVLIFLSLNITTVLLAMIILVPEKYTEDSAKNIAFLITIPFSLTLTILANKYSSEHKQAQKIMHTPKTKYGWYALIIGMIIISTMYLLAFVTKS